jgi:hypothetical protein
LIVTRPFSVVQDRRRAQEQSVLEPRGSRDSKSKSLGFQAFDGLSILMQSQLIAQERPLVIAGFCIFQYSYATASLTESFQNKCHLKKRMGLEGIQSSFNA